MKFMITPCILTREPNYMKTDDGRPMIFMCDSRGVGVSNGSSTPGTIAQQNRFLEMLRTDVKADDGDVNP
jgi:hypothetical protein